MKRERKREGERKEVKREKRGKERERRGRKREGGEREGNIKTLKLNIENHRHHGTSLRQIGALLYALFP